MALIPCRECQREISSEALACPHCGAPSHHPALDTEPSVSCAHCHNPLPGGDTYCPNCNSEVTTEPATEVEVMRGMTPNQRAAFQSQLAMVRKDRAVALLLTLFLGGIGVHRFYLGQVGLGLLYLFFCWTFIPLAISLFELFVIMGRVDEYNMRQARQIASGIVATIR